MSDRLSPKIEDRQLAHSPAVSVLMSVFNAERHLPEAVESILGQSWTDFEFLIIDDGSTDQSLSILKKYASQDSRIRLSGRENRGIPKTVNELLAMARGQYIARMDADDIATANRLSIQVRYLQDHPAVVCVGGYFDLIDEAGRYLTTLRPPVRDDEIQSLLLKGHAAIQNSTAMMRRDALDRCGDYDERFPVAEDFDLWLRLGEAGELANLDATLVRYRLHSNSISERYSGKHAELIRDACERAYKRRGIEGRMDAFRPWRPEGDSASIYAFMLKYGWWAWNSCQRKTAMIYGLRAIHLRPLAGSGWVLLGCALLKRFDAKRQAAPRRA